MVAAWSLPERYLATVGDLLGRGLVTLLAMPARTQSAGASLDVDLDASLRADGRGSTAAPAAPNARSPKREFLRGMALSTWRYFLTTRARKTTGWSPDNVQEDPPASRTGRRPPTSACS